MDNEIMASLLISNCKGVGSRIFKNLVDSFGTASQVLKNLETVKEIFGDSIYNTLNCISKDDFLLAEDAIKKSDKQGIKIIPYSSDEYPKILKHIPDPPPVLYVKGNLPDNLKCISIVGTRKPSTYGKYIIENIVRPLAKNGVCIVSGLATGIDTMAHIVALEEEAFTVAVLGNGIDIVYPPENKKIYEMIGEKGCLISEFSPGTKPSKYTFPLRNRIIAGISYATIVVEAPEKSGSLITANLAFEYSRVVLTVPANINLPSASGNNKLIKENIAIPVVSFEDIISNIPFLLSKKSSKSLNRELSDKEKEILNFISSQKHIDEIKEHFNFDEEIDSILFNLIVDGIAKEENGFYYRIG